MGRLRRAFSQGRLCQAGPAKGHSPALEPPSSGPQGLGCWEPAPAEASTVLLWGRGGQRSQAAWHRHHRPEEHGRDSGHTPAAEEEELHQAGGPGPQQKLRRAEGALGKGPPGRIRGLKQTLMPAGGEPLTRWLQWGQGSRHSPSPTVRTPALQGLGLGLPGKRGAEMNQRGSLIVSAELCFISFGSLQRGVFVDARPLFRVVKAHPRTCDTPHVICIQTTRVFATHWKGKTGRQAAARRMALGHTGGLGWLPSWPLAGSPEAPLPPPPPFCRQLQPAFPFWGSSAAQMEVWRPWPVAEFRKQNLGR